MELFSEIYSCYYSVVARILQSAPLSETQIEALIREHAFTESAFYLMPKLCKEGAWNLLEKQGDFYFSVLKNSPTMPLTLLEKRWLKSLLMDKRIHLFLDSNDFTTLSNKLTDIKPLFESKYFYKFDMYTDGDNYLDPVYEEHFKLILHSIHEKRILTIKYEARHKHVSSFECLPLRMEYSHKNDKFRVFCVKISNSYNETQSFAIINISRIIDIIETTRNLSNPPDISKFLQWKRTSVPITLTISSQRNGIERFMMEFASYEKQTELDEDSGVCYASLWYDKTDETEILIKLLSFGPVLTVTGPSDFLKEFKRRVNRQFQLLFAIEYQQTFNAISSFEEAASTAEEVK